MTDTTAAKKHGAVRGALGWLGRQLFPLCVIMWINGVFLRLTVRDSVDLLAPLYYATPWPVLAILTLPFIGVVWRKPKMVLGVIVVAHLFAAAWLLESWRSNEPAKGAADLKVVQWNVDRPIRLLQGTTALIREFGADIVTVAEAMPKTGKASEEERDQLKEKWRREFPDYKVVFTEGNMLLLVRGEITSERNEELVPGSFCSLYDLSVKGVALRVLQSDMIAKPTASRREPIRKLIELADSLSDRPLIIAGDFNTPRDSVLFEAMRKHHSNAWEIAGIRGADTWPWPVPVLSLDQVWSNQRLKPLRCQTAGNWRSDHLWVEVEFVFGQTSDASRQ